MLVAQQHRRGRGLVAAAALTSALTSGCAQATPTHRLQMVPTEAAAATSLSDVRLRPGADCVVALTSGDLVRGALVQIDAGAIVLDVPGPPRGQRRLADADIASVGRVVGRSKPRRAWTGALIGAVLSLPLSISEPGDAVLVGAFLGGLLGGRTGDSRIEILLRR